MDLDFNIDYIRFTGQFGEDCQINIGPCNPWAKYSSIYLGLIKFRIIIFGSFLNRSHIYLLLDDSISHLSLFILLSIVFIWEFRCFPLGSTSGPDPETIQRVGIHSSFAYTVAGSESKGEGETESNFPSRIKYIAIWKMEWNDAGSSEGTWNIFPMTTICKVPDSMGSCNIVTMSFNTELVSSTMKNKKLLRATS